MIGAVVSVYQVVTADDWKFEISHQVATWSGAIAGGELGAGVGALVGPVGTMDNRRTRRQRDDTACMLVLWWKLEPFH